MFDYYEKLGVSPEADAETIQRAYGAKTPKTPEVEEAFQVLNDAAKKKNYDYVRQLRLKGQAWTPEDLIMDTDIYTQPFAFVYTPGKLITDFISPEEPSYEEIKACFLLAAGLRSSFELKESVEQIEEGIKSFFSSKKDNDYSEHSSPSFKEYRLFFVQKQLENIYYQQAKPFEKPEPYTMLSGFCLELANLFWENNQNFFLQATFFLKLAIKFESNQSLQLQYESAIVAISIKMLKNFPFSENLITNLYFYLHVAKLLSNLSQTSWPIFEALFQHKLQDQRFNFKEIVLPPIISSLDMLQKIDDNHPICLYMKEYLDCLALNIIENPLMDPIELNLIQRSSLDEIYDTTSQIGADFKIPNLQTSMRFFLITKIACDHNNLIDDIEKRLNTTENSVGLQYNFINIDAEGWSIPGMKLPYPNNVKTYQSINGLSFNYQTGQIDVALMPWDKEKPEDEDNPAHRRAFSYLEVQEFFRLGLEKIKFDLNVINGAKKLPVRQEIYFPKILDGTYCLSAFRHADLKLKELTEEYEIQHEFPYAQRPTNEFIETLHKDLKFIIQEYSRSKQETSDDETIGHRFWLAPAVMSMKKEVVDGVLQYTFGEAKMLVKTESFFLETSEKIGFEGWNIFIFPDELAFRSTLSKMPSDSSAIMIVKETNKVYFSKGQIDELCLTMAEPDELLTEICLQPLNENYQLLERENKNPEEEDGEMEVDNSNLIYKFTKHITSMAKREHRFSASRIFAEELTIHFDEFAVLFPEFERVKQLSVLSCVISEIKEQQKENQKWIDENSASEDVEIKKQFVGRTQLKATFDEMLRFEKYEEAESTSKCNIIPGTAFYYVNKKVKEKFRTHTGGVTINPFTIKEGKQGYVPPKHSAFSKAPSGSGPTVSNLSDVIRESIHCGSKPLGFGSNKPGHLMCQQGLFSGAAATAMPRGAGGESIAIGASSPFAVSSDNDPISAMLGPRTQAQKEVASFVASALKSDPILAAPSSFAVAAERARANEPTSYVDFSSSAQKTSMSFESMALKSDNIFDAAGSPLFSRPAHPAQRIKMEKFGTKLGRHSSQFFNKKNGQYTSIEKMLLESARSNIYRGTTEVTLFKGGDPGDGMYYKGKYDPAGKKFMFEGGASFSRSIVLDVGHVDLSDFSSFDYYIEAARVDAIFNGKMEVSAKGITAEIHAEAGVKLLTATGVATARGNFMGITFNVTTTNEVGLGYTAAAGAGVDVNAIRQKASIYYKIGARLGVGVGQATRIEIGKDEVYLALLKENNQKQLQNDPDFKYIDEKMNNRQIPSGSEMEYYETQVNNILIKTQRQRWEGASADAAHPQDEVTTPQRSL